MLDARDADEIADRFRLGTDAVLTGPVARGEVGQVWRLTTSLGAWAVKEPFEPPSTVGVDDDAAYQDAVRTAGVSMPAVVRTIDGKVLADIGSAAVRVFEWVDLEARDPMLDCAAVGSLISAIHRVRYAGVNDVHPWYTQPVGEQRWDELVRDLNAARAPFAEQMAALRDELVGLEELLEWPSNLQTCHRDLFADNVLRTSMGSLCVIDWENSGLAEPSQELGLVLFEYGCGDARRVRALYEAYVDSGGPGRVERPGDFSMVIAQIGHIGELSCRRWLDPSRAADRAHNAARVDEFVSQPITREAIDAILEVVR
ncbi:MAG: aminoglycoside phosphotransferase family protein [Acidimicrobiales bacterium]